MLLFCLRWEMLTCYIFLLEVWCKLKINDALYAALQCSKLGVQAKCEEHEKEEDGPQITKRKLIHSLSKQNKGKSSATSGLKRKMCQNNRLKNHKFFLYVLKLLINVAVRYRVIVFDTTGINPIYISCFWDRKVCRHLEATTLHLK